MFAFFEKLVSPYPTAEPVNPPRHLARFIWHCTESFRLYIAMMAFCSAVIGTYDALLYSMLGKIIDQLAVISPDNLWSATNGQLLTLAGILLAGIVISGFSSLLRWQFHRLMLAQSTQFYSNEFAGRVSAKVMQTALAACEIVFVLADVLIFIATAFVSVGVMAGSLQPWLLLPFLAYLILYLVVLVAYVPRLTRIAQAQADSRSMLTGRITDAYSNIMTIKLFSHSHREANYARVAMQEYLGTAYVHSRLRYYFVDTEQYNDSGSFHDSLRASIGMVTQDTSLLHRSIRDNIIYGRPDATEADMIRAAQRAGAHDFIQRAALLMTRRWVSAG